MQDFRNLKVWERAQHFVVEVYKLTSGFPKSEQYGLTSQIQRAAVSIVANIAEGCGRGSDADFARFLQMAVGSAFEVDALLIVAHELNYLDDVSYHAVVPELAEVKRILNAFLQTVRRAGDYGQQLIAKSK
jgi:four helix bundle protein